MRTLYKRTFFLSGALLCVWLGACDAPAQDPSTLLRRGLAQVAEGKTMIEAGGTLTENGHSLVNEAQAMIERSTDGKESDVAALDLAAAQVAEGNEMVALGSDKIREGRQLIESGTALVRTAQAQLMAVGIHDEISR